MSGDIAPPQRYKEKSYCVGGALGRGLLGLKDRIKAWWRGYPHESQYNFPCSATLVWTLQKYNLRLDNDIAYAFAQKIVIANDDGRYATAWLYAEDALAWPYSIDRVSSAELRNDYAA